MSDSNIPIDIHTNKLLEWLISRRHCLKDYQNSLNEIRNKIRDALSSMPQNDEIKSLLQKNVFDYYICLQVIEILRDTEKDSKNFFGQYTSKRFQDWNQIIKEYEKNNLYLAEDAQNLIRNVNYEVPALKKLSNKLEQQISDAERMSENLRKQSKNYLNDYSRDAKKLGIEGIDIRRELASQLEVLPEKLDHLTEKLQSLVPVCNYYKAFTSFILQSSPEILPKLQYLLAKGNTTYFEFRTGNPPEVIEEFKLTPFITELVEEDNNQANNEIDFGDGEIDFGDDAIDFGDDAIDFGDNANEIDFGDEPAIASEKSIDNQTNSVAKGDDAQSVLLNSVFRNSFINELLELEAFFTERLHEMQSDHVLSSHLFQNAPSVLQMASLENVCEMMSSVEYIRKEFESSALKVLYYMKDSPKYIDNVHRKLSHLKTLSKTVLDRAEDLEKKREQLILDLQRLGPQTTGLIQVTKNLQERIEKSISSKYNNRPVNIMGGVQVL